MNSEEIKNLFKKLDKLNKKLSLLCGTIIYPSLAEKSNQEKAGILSKFIEDNETIGNVMGLSKDNVNQLKKDYNRSLKGVKKNAKPKRKK